MPFTIKKAFFLVPKKSGIKIWLRACKEKENEADLQCDDGNREV